MKSIKTCLLYVGDQAGKAEEAVKFYTSIFPNSQIIDIEYYQADDNEPEGMVKTAVFSINGTDFMAMDSSLAHQFSFSPSVSIYVECESEAEIDEVYNALRKSGQELMPLDNYGFSDKFGWLNDQYGVSWQLNLPH